ncbi:MAG: homoserine dehydrogenase [Alphaproteobacteria bacterium]|nr:homoserine dehydrogenase [Alphaproteobacteria bacterium]
MSAPLKIAVAGLGTVGAGTLALLKGNAAQIESRCGRPIVVSAVSARNRDRDRGVSLAGVAWYDDPVLMASEADAEVVVELIGGADGPAKALCETAIARGRHVVTANKAMLAHHGTALARAAEAAGVTLGFEAAVAGGIPIIKALREGLVANRLQRVYGILNGTCNYILTTMRETGRDFGDVLSEAQSLGYAEADPSFDIDGVDTAHKLAILASLAFGAPVSFESVYVEGIRHITAMDIEYAEQLGYRIKLLGLARLSEHGIEQRVHPCMVSKTTAISRVDGVFNAVVAEGDQVGRSVYEGRGAGGGPTASAVVADIVDIAMGRRAPTFGVPVSALERRPSAPMARHRGAYYIRLMVADRPGVFADIAAALRDEGVSMKSVDQRSRSPGESVPVVMTVHETEEEAMLRALARIEGINAVMEPPRLVRIEEL